MWFLSGRGRDCERIGCVYIRATMRVGQSAGEVELKRK